MDINWDPASIGAAIWLGLFALSIVLALLGVLIENKTKLTSLGGWIRVTFGYFGIILLLIAIPLIGILTWKGSDQDWHTLGSLGVLLLIMVGSGITLSGGPPGR